MIPYDEEWRFNPDCSTCKHRQPRVRSKRTGPDKPRTKDWVCMVEGRAIGEHGTWMHESKQMYSEDGTYLGFRESWVQDIPCKCNLKDGKGWFALDYESIETGKD